MSHLKRFQQKQRFGRGSRENSEKGRKDRLKNLLAYMQKAEDKTKKQVCIGKMLSSIIFEQIEENKYAIYEQMPDNAWQLKTALEYEDFIPLTRTPLTHPPVPTEYENDEVLYNAVRNYIYRHLDLPNPLAYDILTSFIFKTWIEELFDFTPYLGFYGREAVGKTRALEILKELCFRGWLTTGLTTATLFRLVEKFSPTLLIDESEFLTSEERRELIGLINAGQRRGIMIPRMKENGQEAEFFSVYCPKAISGTQELKKATTSRMIVFTMTKNIRPVPRGIDKTEGSKLRSQLLMWRFKKMAELKNSMNLKEKLVMMEPKAKTEFKELEPLDGRTYELFYPLYYSTAAASRPNILEFAKELEQSKLLAEKTVLASMVFEAICNLQHEAKRGLLLLKDIAAYVNKDQPAQYWITEKRIGSKCSQMGFEKTRTNRGSAIILNTTVIDRLRKDPRYSTDLLNYIESDESDESEAKTERASGDVTKWKTIQ
jgi:hypothetical protein